MAEDVMQEVAERVEDARKLKTMVNYAMAQPIFFPSRSMKVKNKRRALHNERTKRR